jgi:tetratricopeptide (TPR) repeat protein
LEFIMGLNVKFAALALAAAAAVGAAPAPATQPATAPSTQAVARAEELFKQGTDAMFQGDYPKAIDLLRKAAAEDKSKTSYRVHLARAYRYAGQDKQAEALLDGILKATPDHVEAGQLLGDIYARQENWKRVVEVIEPLLKYRHDYPTYHLLAEAKYTLDDHESARRYFEEAIKLNPKSASDHYQLGNIYLAGNFFALAADSYQQALGLGLNSPVLHYKLGTAYFNLRNYFGPIQVVNVKAGKPGEINGDWYLIEPVPGQPEQFRVAPSASAVYQVAKAIADGIDDRADIHFLLANIYLNAGRYQQAGAMFKKIEPTIAKEDKPLFYFYYSQAAFGTGDYDGYLALLKKAIDLDKAAYGPTLVDAYVKVADQYNQAGKLEEYIKYLGLAVAESPQNAALHLQLGDAYQEAQQYAKAVTQWKMVLDLEPEHPKRLELLNLMAKFSKATAATGGPATQPAGKGA